jgi:hypothetical protein
LKTVENCRKIWKNVQKSEKKVWKRSKILEIIRQFFTPPAHLIEILLRSPRGAFYQPKVAYFNRDFFGHVGYLWPRWVASGENRWKS